MAPESSPLTDTAVLVADAPGADVERVRDLLSIAGVRALIPRTSGVEELVRLAENADAIMTCFAQVPAEVLRAAPRCLTVARFGVGLDNIDVGVATELGMIVSNVVDYCIDEVADHTLLLLLALARRLVPYHRDVARGEWGQSVPGSPVRLRGLTLGVVGLGAIGRALVPRMQALGVDVLAVRRSSPLPAGVREAPSLPALLREADAVSLHAPLTPHTRHLIGAAELALMKPTAWLINTSRGGLVDTDALLAALEAGRIAGAALDVTEPEPLPAAHPLRVREDVVLTPHVAFASQGSLQDLCEQAVANVLEVLHARVPARIVNPGVLSSPALRARDCSMTR